MSDTAFLIFLGINYFIALISLTLLWRTNAGIITKIFWSMVLLMPFLGLAFYWALFNPPPSLPPDQRVGVHPYAAPFTKDTIDRDHGVGR